VYKPGYKDAHQNNFPLSASDSVLPVPQLVDRNYQ